MENIENAAAVATAAQDDGPFEIGFDDADKLFGQGDILHLVGIRKAKLPN